MMPEPTTAATSEPVPKTFGDGPPSQAETERITQVTS